MNERMSINEVLAESGLSNNYVRKAIAAGKLPVTKELIPGTRIPKNWIERADFEAWRANIGVHARADGRNKFVLYMRPDEIAAVMERLADLPEVAETIARANQKTEVESESEVE